MTVYQPLVYLLVQVCFLGLVEGNASKTITVTNVVQKNEHNIESVSVLNPDGGFANGVTTAKVGNGIRITAPSKNYTAIISAEGQKDRYYNLDMQCPGNQDTCDLESTAIQTKTEDNVLSFVLSFTGPDNGFGADMKIIGFRADWEPNDGCQIIDPSQTYTSNMLNCEGGWFSKFRRSENNGYTYEKKVMLTMLNNYEKGLQSYALLLRATDVQNIKVGSNGYHFDDYELKTVPEWSESDVSMNKPNFGNRWFHLIGCIQFPTANYQYDTGKIKIVPIDNILIDGMNEGPVTLGNLKQIASLCARGIAEEQSKEQI